MLLYAGLFTLIAIHGLGWWHPAIPEQDPNVLATWRPALSIIFSSLQAGFWEESLFRAIPLGLAGLLGARFGCRKSLIIEIGRASCRGSVWGEGGEGSEEEEVQCARRVIVSGRWRDARE